MAFAGILFGTTPTAAESANPNVEKVTVSVGGVSTTLVPFPHKYIQLSSWETNPNQREEIKAYRDDNTRNLTRYTAAGMKTSIKFKTRPFLHLVEKTEIQKFFTDHETDAEAQLQRKVSITFWNDETNDYQTGFFYRPNMAFTIEKISGTDIVYREFQFELVEY